MSIRKLKTIEIQRLSLDAYRQASKTPLTVVLDDVRSMHNVGSVFRTCDAFRIERLLLCGITPMPPSAEIHKTALGAEDSVEWMHFDRCEDAISWLRNHNHRIYCLEQAEGSVDLDSFIVPEGADALALVLGNEVKGVHQSVIDLSDGCIEIAQYGTKHSLNVSVAAGIAIYSITKLLNS